VLFALVIVCAAAAPASAQAPRTFMVTVQTDGPAITADGLCPHPCTLRQAIQEANFFSGRDRIEVPAGTYSLTTTGAGEENNQTGDLDITEGVEIVGAGARTTIVDGNLTDRVFDVDAGFTTIQGLTITRGRVLTAQPGGGLRNLGAETHLIDVAVVDNNSIPNGQGGGLHVAGPTLQPGTTAHLRLTRVLVQGNSARFGGGLLNQGVTVIENSTFSGNVATTSVGSQGGGAIDHQGSVGTTLTINWSTFAGNQAPAGFGTSINTTTAQAPQVRSTIFGDSGGSSCKPVVQSHGGNIENGETCGLTQPTDRQNTDPLLGPFADNGGPTNTHLPATNSPAIDAGTGPCPPQDQRGAVRPFGPACDSGAVEVHFSAMPPLPPVPSVITLDPAQAERRPGDDNVVTATVRNGDGTAAPNRSLRYDIDGPNDGAGTATTDAAGRARVTWEGVRQGDDTLTVYVDTNQNLTHDPPGEPVAQARVTWSLPTPRPGRTMNIEPVSGIVRIREPATAKRKGVAAAGGTTTRLTEGKTVPIGTVVDVRSGRVSMSTASNQTGGIQKGEFYGGVYQTVQSGTSMRPITEMRLTESLVCQPNRRGKVAPARARSRRLWGNARGRYRTRGRHSAATVRGTVWLQKDTCTRTTTVVREGTVIVRDFAKRKNVRVKAGRRYTARQRTSRK
jgi:hypothetical protein